MPDDVISVFAVDSSIFLSHKMLLFLFAIIPQGPKIEANKEFCAEYSIFLRKVTSGDPHQSASFSFCHLFTLIIDFGTLSDLLPPSGTNASLTLFSPRRAAFYFLIFLFCCVTPVKSFSQEKQRNRSVKS